MNKQLQLIYEESSTLNIKEVAKILKVDRNVIYRIINVLGIKTSREPGKERKILHEDFKLVEKRFKDEKSGKVSKLNYRSCPESESILFLHPEYQEYWDGEKNEIDIGQIRPISVRKFWWICENNHNIYQSPQVTIKKSGFHCQKCQSLKFAYPEIFKEWDHQKNSEDPEKITYGSGKKIWWRCKKGHSFRSQVTSRTSGGHGCRVCAGQGLDIENYDLRCLEATFPEIAKEWDYSKNKEKPSEIFPNTNRKFWWLCEKNHSYSATPNNRINGKNCTYCSGKKAGYGNSLKDLYPYLANEYDLTKNKRLPSEITPGSNYKVWWKCSICFYSWDSIVSSRVRSFNDPYDNTGCPSCSGRIATAANNFALSHPDKVRFFDLEKNYPLKPTEILPTSQKRIWWKCDFGHSWEGPAQYVSASVTSGCRECTPQTSANEIRLYVEIKERLGNVLWREKIYGREIDIYLPDYKIGIEYDGFNYHKDKENLDFEKGKYFEEKNITIIRIKESGLTTFTDKDLLLKTKDKEITEDLLSQILKHIFKFLPDLGLFELCNDQFFNNKKFREIISQLPAPESENSLEFVFPEISSEWNYEKNDPLTPKMFYPRSGKKVWWKCSFGHEWQTTIDKRTRLDQPTKCPYCSNRKLGYGNSLGENFPNIAKDWHPKKNGNLTPFDVTYVSGKKVWWICENNHEYSTKVFYRTIRGNRCKYCPGPGKNRKYIPSSPEI